MDCKIVLKDLAKPGEQLVARTTTERAEVAVCPQERVLHKVRCPSLGDQVGIEPARRDQQKIFTARLERPAQNLTIAGAASSSSCNIRWPSTVRLSAESRSEPASQAFLDFRLDSGLERSNPCSSE